MTFSLEPKNNKYLPSSIAKHFTNLRKYSHTSFAMRSSSHGFPWGIIEIKASRSQSFLPSSPSVERGRVQKAKRSRRFFYGLIIMVISDCHESGTRLTVARFTESRADGKKQHRCFSVTKIIGCMRSCAWHDSRVSPFFFARERCTCHEPLFTERHNPFFSLRASRSLGQATDVT